MWIISFEVQIALLSLSLQPQSVIIINLNVHFFFGLELANKEGKYEVFLDDDGEQEDDPNDHPNGEVDDGGCWVEVDLRELAADCSRNQSKHQVSVWDKAFQGIAWATREGFVYHSNAQ